MSSALHSVPSAAAAFATGWLEAGHGHRVYYEQAGAADGVPVVLLHGGPGSGATARQREIFDAARWRIVQFDQRGSGRSTPLGGIEHNHTDALIADIEMLRTTLGIERWLVCGGSWGASLALAYAARHRDRVAGLLLRGVFLTGQDDLDWFFHDVAAVSPEANAEFLRAIPRNWHRNVVAWLDRCFSRNDERCAEVAVAWQRYEARLSEGQGSMSMPPVATPPPLSDESAARLIAKYRVQSHYLARRCFLGDAALLRAANTLRGVPVAIVHGELDRICRPSNAWRVHRSCPGSRLAWAAGAGHNPFHPSLASLMRSATDRFAAAGHFSDGPAASESRA